MPLAKHPGLLVSRPFRPFSPPASGLKIFPPFQPQILIVSSFQARSLKGFDFGNEEKSKIFLNVFFSDLMFQRNILWVAQNRNYITCVPAERFVVYFYPTNVSKTRYHKTFPWNENTIKTPVFLPTICPSGTAVFLTGKPI